LVKHPGALKYQFDQNLVRDYLRSQDIEDPQGKILNRIYVSDSDIYQATGYLYAKGEDPASLNLHPPLVKYLFGFSILLTNNPFYVQIVFGLILLFLTYFLGIKLYKNNPVALAGTILLLVDPVFGGMMDETLLDLGQAVFALLYTIMIYFYPLSYILSGVVLGLFAASKFWSTAIIFVTLIYGFKIFIQKEKIVFKNLAISFLVSIIVFALTYIVSFIREGGIFNLISYQGRVLNFMLTHNSASLIGGPIILFLTNYFVPWWERGIDYSNVWTFLWPAGFVASIILAVRTKIKDRKFFFYVFPIIYLLLTSTQVPFARYFILILPYFYLNLGKAIVDFLPLGHKFDTTTKQP
jgi:hypothetical protein